MKVHVSSKVTLLRPQVLSIAFGIMWALLVFTVTLVAIVSGDGGGSRLVRIFTLIYPFYGLTIWGLLSGIIFGFISGYLFGFLVGFFYILFVRKIVESDNHKDPVFDFVPGETINVLQEGHGDNPYTIVFVANPLIAELEPKDDPDDEEEDDRFKIEQVDPIIKNRDLFFRTVIRCLHALANNELLKIPHIFSRLRIVTVFDDRSDEKINENALCQNSRMGNEVLNPRKRNFKHNVLVDNPPDEYSDEYEMLEGGNITYDFLNSVRDPEDVMKNIDLVFVISAYEPLFRSTAVFTIDEDHDTTSQEFIYIHPEIEPPKERKRHVRYSKSPGVVALHAYDDLSKTPAHEFAHAMSSLQNGAIMDEYADRPEEHTQIPFMVNKRFKLSNDDPPVPLHDDPTPQHFAKYHLVGNEEANYASDRSLSSKSHEWLSYFPERNGPGSSCTMDNTVFNYRFDKLIFDFMYDRLLEKLNR